jgi:O-succinylbenzoate synthase
MHLEEVEVSWVDLALRAEVGTSGGVHGRRPVVLLRVVCDGQEGWGECGALLQGTLVDPPTDRVWDLLVDHVVPRLLQATQGQGGEVPGLHDLAAACLPADGGVPQRMAWASVEMALLDAALRRAGDPLARHLGVPRTTVPYGGVAGIPDHHTVATLLSEVQRIVDAGAARVRLKIAPGWDITPVAAVRSQFPALALQVDANGAYCLGTDDDSDAEKLVDLDGFGLTCIEQPMEPGDLHGHAVLAERLDTLVALDESLGSVADLERALAAGACEVACLKPARLGGIDMLGRAASVCAASGTPAFVGGFFETGLARAVNACLAGLPGLTLPGDVSAPTGYLAVDPAPWPPFEGSGVPVWHEPGVGPAPTSEVLTRFTRKVRRFEVPDRVVDRTPGSRPDRTPGSTG